MGSIRVRLLKGYKHPNKVKPWPVNTVLQLSPQLASELMHDKIAELYNGEYPPKEKIKMSLKNLKPK